MSSTIKSLKAKKHGWRVFGALSTLLLIARAFSWGSNKFSKPILNNTTPQILNPDAETIKPADTLEQYKDLWFVEKNDGTIYLQNLLGKGLTLVDYYIGDINQNGVKDYVIEVIGTGCVSCHYSPLYIVEKDEIIFEYIGDDLNILSVGDGKIVIKELVRKYDTESMCCPSEFKKQTIKCTAVSCVIVASVFDYE